MAAKPAWAAGGDCPTAFDSYDCAVDSADVCYAGATGSDQWYARSAQSTDEGATITVVTDYVGGGTGRYSAWGWVSGERFCCGTAPPIAGFSSLKVHGSDHADTLKFTHAGTWNLNRVGRSLHCTIDAENGNDTVVGSNSTSSGYTESLSGGDNCDLGGTGNDTVTGGNGDDEIYGACGDDTLIGGNGNDMIRGDAGDDVIIGGTGNDTLDGGDGNDGITGGDGDDDLDTTAGESDGYDALCGDAGADTLKAYFGDGDQLWGADGTDTEDCGNDLAVGYSGLGTSTDCTFSGVITTRPAECP